MCTAKLIKGKQGCFFKGLKYRIGTFGVGGKQQVHICPGFFFLFFSGTAHPACRNSVLCCQLFFHLFILGDDHRHDLLHEGVERHPVHPLARMPAKKIRCKCFDQKQPSGKVFNGFENLQRVETIFEQRG